jgi:hypothetical protein
MYENNRDPFLFGCIIGLVIFGGLFAMLLLFLLIKSLTA